MPRPKQKQKSGFTIIELLLVLVMTGIFATLIFDSFIEYRDRQALRVAVVEVSSIIKETRQKTISAETTSQFGVHISTSSLVVFEGAVYDPLDAENQTFDIEKVEVSSDLTGDVDELVFARLSGEPSATGTISVYHQNLNSTTSITIHQSGLVE